MKRRLLSAFLAVMMVLTMAPVAFAGNDSEVSSTVEVSTAAALQTALTNATNGTVIKLTDNITVSSRAKFSGQSMTVTLDLNNYTLTGSDGDYALSNENGGGATTGTLIVKNGTIKRADDVKDSTSTVHNYGQMELNNVQVQGNYIVVKNEETATLTMNNCTLTAPDVYPQQKIMATIVTRHGSAPQGLGTKMLICQDGQCVGTIGGGCMEARVIQIARLMAAGENEQSRICHVDMTGNEAEDEGMVCGGEVDVFLEVV